MISIFKKRTQSFISLFTNLITINLNLITLKINFTTLHFVKFYKEV